MSIKTTVISEEQLKEQLAYCSQIRSFWLEQNMTPLA